MHIIYLPPSVMAPHFKNLLRLSTTFGVLLCMASAISLEGEALLRWKSTLLNSTSLFSWSPDDPICYWNSVTCNNAGHVTELHLSGWSINGTLDAFHFAAFRHLAMLDLSENDLVRTIPTNISLLLKLTHLDLSNNNLVGAIPYQLSKLRRITLLDLGNNHLTNPDVTKFSPVSILQVLHLGDNKLNGTFPQFILNHTFVRLEDLDLSRNSFTGLIPANLQDIAPKLRFLDLSSNGFLELVLMSLSRLAKLFYPNLAKNNLTGGIPTEFSDLNSLDIMDLSWNMFSGGIPKELGNLTNLMYLDLSWNMFSGGIPKELGNLDDLSIMNLSWNMLSVGLPPTFSEMHEMLDFHVGNNHARKKNLCYIDLPAWLCIL